jgi:hypothetical protein
MRRAIAELMKQAQAGEIELARVDEAGFAPQPPNRSALTKKAVRCMLLQQSGLFTDN